MSHLASYQGQVTFYRLVGLVFRSYDLSPPLFSLVRHMRQKSSDRNRQSDSKKSHKAKTWTGGFPNYL